MLTKRIVSVIKGLLIYNRLKKEYGKDCQCYICPFKGTGDIYLIGLLYCGQQIERRTGKCFFTVVNKPAANILSLFDIKNVVILTQSESDNLVLFYSLMKNYLPNITLCIDSIPWINHASILWKLRGLNDCNFMDMFQHTVFKMGTPADLRPPKFSDDEFYINSILDISGIKKGRSVIIAPYSNSFPSLKMERWEQISKELKNKGYTVFTNCAGNEVEINGTMPISIPFDYLKPILEAAGNFLAIRSGLCDIVSSAECRQVIIYPDLEWSEGTIFDYFSLNNMGLSKTVKEIIATGKHEMIRKVTDLFPDITKVRKDQL